MRADPVASRRPRGVQVVRANIGARWLTGLFAGRVFVIVRADLSRAAQQRAVAAAILAHPTLVLAGGAP